ncbi:hypothetical protein MP228_007789 [Amoeboaphelidium protococcarum]|nr:hypothetical protein MP228_007789 [Amoeboaphelidium protococcarum]
MNVLNLLNDYKTDIEGCEEIKLTDMEGVLIASTKQSETAERAAQSTRNTNDDEDNGSVEEQSEESYDNNEDMVDEYSRALGGLNDNAERLSLGSVNMVASSGDDRGQSAVVQFCDSDCFVLRIDTKGSIGAAVAAGKDILTDLEPLKGVLISS